MRAPGLAALVLIVAFVVASPAAGAPRAIDVQVSAHLRSDYRFTYDYVDTSSPDCPRTIRASSRVITDMPTVRAARAGARSASASRTPSPRGSANQLGGGFTEVRTLEVTIRKLR